MNYLSKAQWSMLHASQEGASINLNLNTISALYTRALIKFSGPHKERIFKPTKLGMTFLFMQKRFKETPSFKDSRTELKKQR